MGKASEERRISWLDDREPTVLGPFRPGGTLRGQSARAECLLPIGRAEPSRAELEAVAPASPTYNSLISPGACLFQT